MTVGTTTRTRAGTWARCASAASRATGPACSVQAERSSRPAPGTPRTTACGSMGTAPRWRLRPDTRPARWTRPRPGPCGTTVSGDRQVHDHRNLARQRVAVEPRHRVRARRLGAERAVCEVARRGAPGRHHTRVRLGVATDRHRTLQRHAAGDRDGHASDDQVSVPAVGRAERESERSRR